MKKLLLIAALGLSFASASEYQPEPFGVSYELPQELTVELVSLYSLWLREAVADKALLVSQAPAPVTSPLYLTETA